MSSSCMPARLESGILLAALVSVLLDLFFNGLRVSKQRSMKLRPARQLWSTLKSDRHIFAALLPVPPET
jgi:hypothetical protein